MIYFLLIFFIIFIDQWSKKEAFIFLTTNEGPYRLTKRFQLRLAKNPGAFYGLFKNKRKLLIAISFISIIACSVLLYFGILNESVFSFNMGISCIMGGAIGNLIDRIKRGYVIDFLCIKIKKGPIFNLADLFILIGACTLIYLEIFYDIF